MEDLLIILRHTPYWVWIVLGYLIYAGIKASQPRRQSLARMLVVPIVFMVWGVSAIFHTLLIPLAAAGGFLLTLIVGLGIGWTWGKRQALIGRNHAFFSARVHGGRWV
nr:hypothetical protein KXZ65_21600 [Pectobacterium sp. PL152]